MTLGNPSGICLCRHICCSLLLIASL